jgi:hypothetical protein
MGRRLLGEDYWRVKNANFGLSSMERERKTNRHTDTKGKKMSV